MITKFKNLLQNKFENNYIIITSAHASEVHVYLFTRLILELDNETLELTDRNHT